MYKGLFAFLLPVFAAMPSSSNFTLNGYDFGSGANSSSSSNYQLNGSAGAQGGQLTSGSYALPAGIKASTSLSAPAAATFTNPSNEYNRLNITLSVSGFASDTKYLIAISDDNFTTTKYVQPDQTIGTNLGISNYQTYAAWGGASGCWVLGLSQNTTYKVKVAALQGPATGSSFGPTATAATTEPSLTVALSTSLTSTPPFAVGFTSLTPGSVVAADATVTAAITTNAQNGGSILLRDQNGGLVSSRAAYTITSASTDLTSANSGYGAQISAVSQAGGGPLVAASPFNGAGNNVGLLSNTWQELATFATALSNGSVTTTFKAKASSTVPASTDFTDTLTVSISLLF